MLFLLVWIVPDGELKCHGEQENSIFVFSVLINAFQIAELCQRMAQYSTNLRFCKRKQNLVHEANVVQPWSGNPWWSKTEKIIPKWLFKTKQKYTTKIHNKNHHHQTPKCSMGESKEQSRLSLTLLSSCWEMQSSSLLSFMNNNLIQMSIENTRLHCW